MKKRMNIYMCKIIISHFSITNKYYTFCEAKTSCWILYKSMTKLLPTTVPGTVILYPLTFGAPATIGGSQKTFEIGIFTW